MWGAILKFLEMAAKKAGEAALKGGKLAAKGATEVGKMALKSTDAGKLLDAFKGMTNKTAEIAGKGEVPIAPADYFKSPEAQIGISPSNVSQGYGDRTIGAKSQAILQASQITPDSNSTQQDNQPTPKPSIIPSNYKQFIRQPGMQFVPGPEGSVIGGQGEVMPGYGMQSPQSTIPSRYLQMNRPLEQQPIQQQSKYPGVLAGLKEGFLGMPSTAQEPQPSEKGRQTAYYAGKLIPDIVRSKLGVNTTGEEARQQQLMEATSGGQVTPEYQEDLSSAMDIINKKGLMEEEKIFMYQKLAAKYPKRSAELKRIFFPQSSNMIEDIMQFLQTNQR